MQNSLTPDMKFLKLFELALQLLCILSSLADTAEVAGTKVISSVGGCREVEFQWTNLQDANVSLEW